MPSTSELRIFAALAKGRPLPPNYPPGECALDIDLDDPGLLTPRHLLSSTSFPTSPSLLSPGPSEFGMEPLIVEQDHSLMGTPAIEAIKVAPSDKAEDLIDGRKRRNGFVRAVKKAGVLAAKTFKAKSLTMRRDRKLSKQDVRVIFHAIAAATETSADNTQSAVIDPNASTDSLTAMRGSPTTLSSFPMSPPTKTPERFLPPPSWRKDPILSLSTVTTIMKLLFKIALFLPYVLLVGYTAFITPSRLSAVAFSPLFGFVPPPSTALGRFRHHARVLPCHVGVACGFTTILNWQLFRVCPTVGVALNIGFAVMVWAVWKDFRLTKQLRGTELGLDDRVTTYKVYKMTVPCPVRRFLRNAGSSKARLEIDEAEELTTDGPLDVVLPLKGDAQEPMRIIVECED